MTLEIPDAYERAIDEPPFANSDEGYGWMANWCDRCIHDGCGLGEDQPQCPLILVALMGRTPAEWLDQKHLGPDGLLVPYSRADQFHCIMFRDRDDPGGREPEPIPDPPGQMTLLPREPYEGARMLLTAPEREKVPA